MQMQYNAEVLPFVREILQQKVLIINISLRPHMLANAYAHALLRTSP